MLLALSLGVATLRDIPITIRQGLQALPERIEHLASRMNPRGVDGGGHTSIQVFRGPRQRVFGHFTSFGLAPVFLEHMLRDAKCKSLQIVDRRAGSRPIKDSFVHLRVQLIARELLGNPRREESDEPRLQGL